MNIQFTTLLREAVASDWWLMAEHHEPLIASFNQFEGTEPEAGSWIDEMIAERMPKLAMGDDGVGEISVDGPMMRRIPKIGYLFGLVGMNDVQALVEEAMGNDQCRALMLDINSPGGTVAGTPELADAVWACSQRKPTMAHVSGIMGSAAYYVGSQAQMIYASPSANVGSIGVMLAIANRQKMLERFGVKVELMTNEGADYKLVGNPYTDMTDEQRQYLQVRLNKLGENFKAAVRRGRNSVGDDAMRGQVFLAQDAMQEGLVDAIGNYQEATEALKGGIV